MSTLASRLRRARPYILALLLTTVASTAGAGTWSHDPNVNVPVVTLPGAQGLNGAVSDGAHGAIVLWSDPNADPFATPPLLTALRTSHVLPTGELDTAWSTAAIPGTQTNFGFDSMPDGAGGAFVTWGDIRNSATTGRDVYVHHLRAGGSADPAWPVGGRALCTAPGGQFPYQPITDGHGGVIVFWMDKRDSATTGATAIVAGHVLANGTVDPAWPVNGRIVCTAAQPRSGPDAIPDGAGGALVAWGDSRNTANKSDIYASHVLANGTIDPVWPANGLAVIAQPNTQNAPTVCTDGAGGMFVTWYDNTNPPSVQHVRASGVVDPAWPVAGPVLDINATTIDQTEIVSDGGTGVYVLWDAGVNAIGNADLYARHLLANGTSDPAWPAGAVRLLPSSSNKSLVVYAGTVVPPGGGLLFQWNDDRSGSPALYVDRMLPNGTVDPAWPALGRLLSPQPTAYGAGMIDDGRGGAIFAWSDLRDSAATDWNVYADRIGFDGMRGVDAPMWHAAKDVPGDQGGKVSLQWYWSSWDNSPGNLVSQYAVWRRIAGAAPALAERARLSALRATPQPGDVRASATGATSTFWEFVGSVPARGTPNYAFAVSTLADSGAGGAAWETYEVDADVAGTTYSSDPDSGYSVDNIAPATPTGLTAAFAAGTTTLYWDPVTATDLANYRLYRGATPGFAIGPASLVATPTTTHVSDVAGHTDWYRLTAIDVHGNESPPAAVLPAGTAGVDGPAPPAALALSLRSRSPANAGATFALALPHADAVSLAAFDAAGRRVRTLLAGPQPAGVRTLAWDLRDDGGRALAVGLYFVRLAFAGETREVRIAVIR